MLREHRLDLGRVHVRASGHDHVAAAIGDVDEPVRVDVTHVAERPETARRGVGGRLADVVEAWPGRLAAQEDLADLARR